MLISTKFVDTGDLRPGYDFVGGGRQSEADAGFVIGLNCGREVECRDLDVFRPMTALPIISAGVNRAAHDDIFGHRVVSWAL